MKDVQFYRTVIMDRSLCSRNSSYNRRKYHHRHCLLENEIWFQEDILPSDKPLYSQFDSWDFGLGNNYQQHLESCNIAKYFLEEILSLRCPRREYLLSYIDVHRSRKILRNNVSFEPQNLNQTGLCPWCFVAVGLWYVSRTDQLLSRAPSRFSISPRCPSDFDISGRDRFVGR